MRMVLTVALVSALIASACSGLSPAAPTAIPSASALSASPSSDGRVAAGPMMQASRNSHACWGEATQVFAQMGEMGEHASQQSTPRLGLRNVAKALFEQGVLPDDSLQALGAFLSSALGLTIDSCLVD